MFICVECQNVFDEPKIIEENHGLDAPPYEYFSVCPYCGGAFTEAYRCDYCGDFIADTYIKLNNGERICSECYIAYELGEEK